MSNNERPAAGTNQCIITIAPVFVRQNGGVDLHHYDELTCQATIANPVGSVRCDAEAFLAVCFIIGPVARLPPDAAITFEGQDVGGDPVEEPAVMDTTTAQPAKFSSASSRARKVFTSRSLVGSSSRITLPWLRSIFARWTRLRSPPERTPTFFCWSAPGN